MARTWCAMITAASGRPMKQVVLLLAASLLLAYVSDSPVAASSLRKLSQRRSREERRTDQQARREAAADAVLLPSPKESARLTVSAEYNALTNAFTKAKASGAFNYCVGNAGTTACGESTGWCQGSFKSYGSTVGSDVCLPYPQYGYAPCGMKLRGKKGSNPYTAAGIHAGGFTLTMDMITSEERSCVLRRRASRRLAQQDTTGDVKPMLLTSQVEEKPTPTLLTTTNEIISSEPPKDDLPPKPELNETVVVIEPQLKLVKPDLPHNPDEPIAMEGMPVPITKTLDDGILYTMMPGAAGEPIAMETPIVTMPMPDDLMFYVTNEMPQDDEFDPNIDPPPLLTDRPLNPEPNWRGEIATTSTGTDAGTGGTQVLFEGGECDLHMRLVNLPPGGPSQECVCFKGSTYLTMGCKAQRAFTVGGKAVFNRWKCKAVARTDCPTFACMM